MNVVIGRRRLGRYGAAISFEPQATNQPTRERSRPQGQAYQHRAVMKDSHATLPEVPFRTMRMPISRERRPSRPFDL
jgi:hypothetical protein